MKYHLFVQKSLESFLLLFVPTLVDTPFHTQLTAVSDRVETAEQKVREEGRRLELRLRLLLLLLRIQKQATASEALALDHVLLLPHLAHIQHTPLTTTCNVRADAGRADPLAFASDEAAGSAQDGNAPWTPVSLFMLFFASYLYHLVCKYHFLSLVYY